MRALLLGSTLLGSSNSINLRRRRARAEPLHHVGTLNPILNPTQRQCLGETYPSEDDRCGVCICETSKFENKLLDGGVDEYAEAATDDSSTWALPQRMEERCLRYLHSLSTGQDTLFIETHDDGDGDGEKEEEEEEEEKMEIELEQREVELENLNTAIESTEEDMQRTDTELEELKEECQGLQAAWKNDKAVVDDLEDEKKKNGWSKEFQSRFKPAKQARNLSLKSLKGCFPKKKPLKQKKETLVVQRNKQEKEKKNLIQHIGMLKTKMEEEKKKNK